MPDQRQLTELRKQDSGWTVTTGLTMLVGMSKEGDRFWAKIAFNSRLPCERASRMQTNEPRGGRRKKVDQCLIEKSAKDLMAVLASSGSWWFKVLDVEIAKVDFLLSLKISTPGGVEIPGLRLSDA